MATPVGIDAVLVPFQTGMWDVAINAEGDFDSVDALDTAILVSLFTDARADASQIALPELRRGWIGNESTPDFELGGLVWLYYQERLTRTVLNGIADAARRSLKWMVDEGIALAVRAEATPVGSGRLDLRIELERPTTDPKIFNIVLWDKTGESFAD